MKLSASIEKFNAAKYSKLITIDGSATNAIEFVGNKKANYIIAGNNGATLNGGKGKDSLRGSAGADVFVYENKGGNDVIYNYDANDTISLVGGAAIKDVKFRSNGDVIVKVGSNFITVKNTSDREITFVENGATKKFSNGIFTDETKTSATLPASFKGTFDLGSYGVTNADNSLSKKAVTLQGSSSDNFLTGGKGREELYGNAGNDTLNGGNGNDLLWGGAGNDTFIYKAGEGKDTIMDYESGELISILDKKDNAGKFSKAIFSDNTLTLTIKGGGKVTLNNVSSSTEFNINNETYRVRGNALIK